MKTPSILIVGYGITDKNLHREIATSIPTFATLTAPNHQLQQPLQKKSLQS